MDKNIRKSYNVKQNAVDQSYIKQLGLKYNPEYEKWAEETAVGLIEYFLKKYEGVQIEIPKLREKSGKSLMGKIKNLEIERLSKLYAVEGISDSEKVELFKLLKERVEEDKGLNEKQMLKAIKKLLKEEDMDLEEFEKKLMVDGLSNSSKTALLRVYTRNLEKKEDIKQIKKLGRKYGKAKANKTGNLEDDLIKYSSITDLRTNIPKLTRLRDANQFLKANDLRGMKIVLVGIPDDLKTNNPRIKQMLKMRSKTAGKEYAMLTHEISVEIGKEFYKDLENDKETLEKFNLEVIQGSSKHKKKKNGYEAEHIKFTNSKEPEYTLEMQFKSEHVENIARGEGMASHQNRPGKSRVLPNAKNDKELLRELDYSVPKYTTFRRVGDKVVAEKQSMLRNTISYYQKQIEPGSEEYEKILKLYNYKGRNEIEK